MQPLADSRSRHSPASTGNSRPTPSSAPRFTRAPRYQPPQTLVSAEQTANIGGGTIWKKADLDEIVKIAKSEARLARSPPTWMARGY